MSVGPERHTRYWRANIRLIALLLTIWAVVSIGLGVLFIEPLNTFRFFKLPLGFWIAQQGAMVLFVLLIFIYAWRMDRLDRNYHEDE